MTAMLVVVAVLTAGSGIVRAVYARFGMPGVYVLWIGTGLWVAIATHGAYA